MIQIRCTKKVCNFLGVNVSDLQEYTDTDAAPGNWYTNIFMIERRKALVFMSEKTLFSFVLTGVRKANIKKIAEAFYLGLYQILEREGFTDAEKQLVLADCETNEFTKTRSRSLLGNLNDLVEQYRFMISYKGGLAHCDLTDIIRRINRGPQRNLGWSTPYDQMLASLKNMNES